MGSKSVLCPPGFTLDVFSNGEDVIAGAQHLAYVSPKTNTVSPPYKLHPGFPRVPFKGILQHFFNILRLRPCRRPPLLNAWLLSCELAGWLAGWLAGLARWLGWLADVASWAD